MSVYQKDIKRIMKQLMLVYETRITSDKNRKLEHFGAVELMLLEHLKENDRVTQNDLFDVIPLRRNKLVGIIKKMISLGYIERVDNPNDKRSNYLVLGEKGFDIMQSYGKHEEVFLDFVLKDMTINEEKTIVKFLSKIQQTNYMK
ncbi:winged helix-turn-helix transcriptional regulator [Acidaminobacter sp. JC074]|uniref:MarR family winged helix-turn-helix transcriptional regulator n=1 Tax=Acidaminobacter sp. JC074 TaxID=2530199 RepID=UPI001F0FFA4F|nr:MarR family winged helix-turn-helix transcriptional regulator [Acidaminobacter sp. JC074]MCH4891291.1 winged helix-turn-helix transcriptional regulator [Acidaminobacter sp. JC074]